MTRTLRALPLLAAVLLAGCFGPKEKVFPLDGATAYRRVIAAEVPIYIFGTGEGALLDSRRIDAPGLVSWPIMAKDREIFRFQAKIEAVDATHTRVGVSLVPATGNAVADRVAKGMADNGDIVRLYRDAMKEEVEASLEGRKPTFTPVVPALTLATIGHMKDIEADFDREIARHDRQEQSYFQKAYASQGLEW